jgi:hypothetical protein
MNFNFKQMLIFLIILLFFTSPAFAYRPLGTEDAGVAGKGIFQTEISYDYLKWSDGKLENVYLFVPIYGLTENFEFSIEIPYLVHNQTDGNIIRGVGDINLVGKYLLFNEDLKTPAILLKVVEKFDNGNFDLGLGSGDKDTSIFVVFSKTLGTAVFHGQFGYTWIGKVKNSDLRDITIYGLAFDYGFSEALHVLCEINGNRHSDIKEADNPANWLLGLTYKLSEKVAFDIASKWGLSKSSPVWNLAIGFSMNIN